jgi:hypothetical protein
MAKFEEEQVRALFTLADIKILSLWKLPNGYWPEAIPENWDDGYEVNAFLKYQRLRADSPWWLVKTNFGLIKIGWRKRVISIDWSDTPVRAFVTEDNVTKTTGLVHAWTQLKAIEYLTKLKEFANE